ncbi:hypothetical protein [Leptospira licerasiae]|uniref:YokE-like PH domain-containing protein n=1 Tax=Leptospira licerasiae str. MMD4847 TaxID=1049971 RepID=A0ABP2RGK6_9LEPT|nr:hypothetical protein [Leptospira licerasiae]EJZ42504.1 hypothetical protein LEP1GSC178_3141 [Leptospira licerasiae str. MMD4847]
MKSKIEQLSYRILEKLKNFHKEVPFALAGIAQAKVLWIYFNFSSSYDNSVLFTESGLYIIRTKTDFEAIKYSEIYKLKIVEQKEVAKFILLTKKDGVQINLEILGGDGKLREVWEVYRFLLRIIEQ